MNRRLALVGLIVLAGCSHKPTRLDLNKQLLRACWSGRIDEVQSALDLGADPNWVARDKIHDSSFSGFGFDSALELAVQNNDIPILELLLKRRASPSMPDALGDTPLTRAICFGDAASVSILLKAGAEVNPSTPTNCSPLGAAVQYGDFELAVQLLKMGAKVNAKSADGMTPILFAAHGPYGPPKLRKLADAHWTPLVSSVVEDFDRRQMVNLLLRHGADPLAKTDDGRSVLDMAKTDVLYKKGSNDEVIAFLNRVLSDKTSMRRDK